MDSRVVFIPYFYNSGCETKKLMSKFVHEEDRHTVLYMAVHEMCAKLCKKDKDILETARMTLEREYCDRWFDFPWQKESQIKDDLKCLQRFIKFLGNREILSGMVNIVHDTGTFKVNGRADLITRGKDGYEAFIVFPKKANKSPHGKSVHTNTDTDLYALTAKAGLEKKYPNITINLVYLFNEADTVGNVGDFVVAKTRKSNIFTLTFPGLYESGEFDYDGLNALIGSVLSEKPPADCFNCADKALCSATTVRSMGREKARELVPETEGYSIPEYTAEQNKVVRHLDGPMLVCAPPGSGKTATLVGRIKHLIDKGVPAEFILAITFTRDAAGELLHRCASFCEKDSMPEIGTIHALALKILTANPSSLDREIRVMSVFERMEIIENLLRECKPLKGFNYSRTKGKDGLYAEVARCLDGYRKAGDRFLAEKGLQGDFKGFARSYTLALDAHGYVGFDDLVPMAIKLMQDNPEILNGLSRRYKYIMVDEYQDVDGDQARFIYMLSKHRNLVVVGDDDQSIYGFRGGSNKYMLEFGKYFPETLQVVFKTNFRSTKELITTSENFIRRNKSRIKKEVTGNKNGPKPLICTGQDAVAVDTAVKRLLSDGYAYKDIAVLATKNSTLESLSRETSIPSVLGKSFLVDSAMFRVILDILELSYGGKNDAVLLHLLTVMGVDPDIAKYPDVYTGDFSTDCKEPAYRALKFINRCLKLISSGVRSVYFADYIFQTYRMEDTAVESAFNGVITTYHAHDTQSLYGVLKYMADFGDETRLEPDTSESVLFITSHESKGMEWRAVILVDDFKDEPSEEQNRLYYVAITRAKERLLILTKDGRTLLNPA